MEFRWRPRAGWIGHAEPRRSLGVRTEMVDKMTVEPSRLDTL